MRHDLPQEGDPYGNVEGWYSNITDKCGEVGEPEDCLPLSISFFESADSGRGPSIPDPGPDYGDLYDYCDVENVVPSTDPPTTVPSGTRIRVEVVCGPPLEPETTTQPEPQPEPQQPEPQQPEPEQPEPEQPEPEQQEQQQQPEQPEQEQQEQEQQEDVVEEAPVG